MNTCRAYGSKHCYMKILTQIFSGNNYMKFISDKDILTFKKCLTSIRKEITKLMTVWDSGKGEGD